MFNRLIQTAGIVYLFSCTPDHSRNNSPKFQQYYVQGLELYQKHCSNCHQPDGKGLGRIYPPLDQSDFMDQHDDEVICIIKYGKRGSMLVNGMEFNMEMKGNPALTELEVAEIATYIYNTWSHQKGLIDVTEVTQKLSDCNR